MRIGRLRNKVEIWDVTDKVDEFGIVKKIPDLLIDTPACIDYISSDNVGTLTKGNNKTVKCTIRFNRQYKIPSSTMFIKWDNKDWDIVNDENWYSLNKYIVLTLVHRSRS